MRTKHMVGSHAFQQTNDANIHYGYGFHAGPAPDRFSLLPDELVARVLSLLPIRDAVAASLLSRRFNLAFAAGDTIRLLLPEFPLVRRRSAAFCSLAASALAAFPAYPLHCLRLSLIGFSGNLSSSFLVDLLAAAAVRGVEDLHLTFPRLRFPLPDIIFAIPTVTSLSLQLHKHTDPLPSPMLLTNLKVFHVRSALVGSFLPSLFGSCRFLKELVLEGCWVHVVDLANAPPSFSQLNIVECKWEPPSLFRVSGAVGLQRLVYVGSIPHEHFVHLEGLVNSNLDFVALILDPPLEKAPSSDDARVDKLVELVGNVRGLKLSPWCIKELTKVEDEPVKMEKMSNVQDLEMEIERRGDGARRITWLLKKFPNVVQLLVSVVPSRSKQKFSDNTVILKEPTSGRQMTLLKKVEMIHINESKSGIELLKFLLKRAPFLETMRIVPSCDGLELIKFKKKVLNLKKASQKVIIEFSATT